MTKTHLQKTVNAAVLSGAQELTNNQTEVEEIVNKVLNAHGEADSLHTFEIIMEERVKISLVKPVRLSFGGLFGYETMNVNATAQAQLRTMGRATGAAPLGINENVALEFYKTYQLKVDSSGVEAGNFGVLALEDVGAKTYEENLRNGYSQELKVGDIVGTQTGNIAGKTREVIQEKINGCPELPRDVHIRDCSRILLIPVYKPYSSATNQLQSVKITGFAYFYITDPMSSTDTAITGMFIKRADTGTEMNGAVLRGAYTVRLTE